MTDAQPASFNAWLSARLGTRRWIIAARLRPHHRAQGATIAIPRDRLRRLAYEWAAENSSRKAS
jgi:hypothetical protein